MPDVVTTSIDYGRIASIMQSGMNTVKETIDRVDNKVAALRKEVEVVRKETMEEITRLKNQLVELAHQQKFDAAYQRAMTEIIRIRQQLERDFGVQKQVRENLLGILQATDLGLITEGTISRCTEELMISAPKYWLAPCLIALAGWITNDESLAKRAIAEACKRDEEKTSLLFALITRRVNAGRIAAGKPTSNVCFEWLSKYFSKQNPKKMRSSIIAYIDCYTNGIFGEDKENICSEHITNWMASLKASKPTFVEEQLDYWKEKFTAYCDLKAMSTYEELKLVSPQFGGMQDYLLCIDAAERDDGIKSYVGEIMEKPVDTEALVNEIDGHLKNLVSEYEEAEEELRYREKYLSYVEEYKGDEKKADIRMKVEAERRYDAPVDFAQRLSDSVFKSEISSSAKKTALKLLKPYINQAFNEFIVANKDAYPQQIGLKITNEGKQIKSGIEGVGVLAAPKKLVWEGSTVDSENRDELVASLKKEYAKTKNERVALITDDRAQKTKKTGITMCCFGFLIIPLFLGLGKIIKSKKMVSENVQKRKELNDYYDKSCNDSVALLNKALDQRAKANRVVSRFLAGENNEALMAD